MTRIMELERGNPIYGMSVAELALSRPPSQRNSTRKNKAQNGKPI